MSKKIKEIIYKLLLWVSDIAGYNLTISRKLSVRPVSTLSPRIAVPSQQAVSTIPNNAYLQNLDGIFGSIYFEIVGFCNASCPWCTTGSKTLQNLDIKSNYINVGDFRNAIDILIKGRFIASEKSVVNLYNWGEPMLHPDLNGILRVLCDRNMAFSLSTNASKLVILENDLLPNLKSLRFSVPGFSQKSYDKIHRFDFDKIIKNMEAFCSNIHDYRYPTQLEMAYHLYQFNIDELPQAVQFCKKNGIDFHPFFAYPNDFYVAKDYLNGSIDKSLLKQMSKEMFLHYVSDLISQSPNNYKCPQLDILTIDEDCNVLTCCFLPKNHPAYSLGKLDMLSYDDIQKEKSHQAVCTNCIQSGAAYWVHNTTTPDFIKPFL